MKERLAIILAIAIIVSTVIVSVRIGADTYTVPYAEKDQWDLSAADYVKNIKSGWNLGNTLEDVCLQSYFGTYVTKNNIDFNNWSSWYNCEFDGYPVDIYNNKITDPKIWESEMSYSQSTITTKSLIDKVHDAGFNAIRIPVTWFNWSNYNSGNFTLPNGVECTGDKISSEIITRVREIIDWACEDNMYIIINMHHDDGVWLHADQDLSTEDGRTRWAYIKTRYENFWKQISYYFRDYGSNVIFAGMNEIVSGSTSSSWTTSSCSYFESNMNELYQIFVDTVRNSGGNNTKRYLAISPWGAKMDKEVSFPTDSKSDGGINRLIVEMHIYNEWTYANPGRNFAEKFDYWQTKYMKNGYGVIIGEGAFTDDVNDDARTVSTQLAYAASNIYGIPFFQWDNGGIGGTSSAKYRTVAYGSVWSILKRSDLTWRYPKQLKAMMDATYTFDSDYQTASVKDRCYYQENTGASYFDFSNNNLLKNIVWRQGKYNDDGTINTTAKNSIYADKISVTPGQTYEIRNNSYYGINSIFSLNVYGYDSNGNKISLGNGQKTKYLWYYVDTKKTQSSIGDSVNFDSELNSDAKITIPSNVVSIAISATAYRTNTKSSQLLGLINSGIAVPQIREYSSDNLTTMAGGDSVNEYPTRDTLPSQTNVSNTIVTSAPSSTVTDQTNKYLYIKSLKNDSQNFRFTFGEEGIPSNAEKFVISTKGNGSTGLQMAFRTTVDASLTNASTSDRISINGTADWITNEVDLTANDYSIYHSLLVYVPANSLINVDNVGFVLEDGSFEAIQDFESLNVGNSYSGLLNIVNDASTLATFGFTGTVGWDFNGEFEIKSETPVITTQPTSSQEMHRVIIDGVEIEHSGDTITLPLSTKKGFIAYTDGTDYYDENTQVTISNDKSFTTVSIGALTMLKGASIRLGNVSGLRFYTVVDTDSLANLPQNATISKGTLITPKDLLDEEDLTLNSSCQTANVLYDSNEYFQNNNTFVGSIVNIKEKNITREFVGRGYITVTLDNYSKTVYADYDDYYIENNSRSVAYIANVYRNTDAYTILNDELKEIVDTWASKYVLPIEEKLLIDWKQSNNFWTPYSSYFTDVNGFNCTENALSGVDLVNTWSNNTTGYDGIKFKLNVKSDNELTGIQINIGEGYYKWISFSGISGETELTIPFSTLDTWKTEAFTTGSNQDIKFSKNNNDTGKINIVIGNLYLYKNN